MPLPERLKGRLRGGYVKTFTYESNGMTFHDAIAVPEDGFGFSVKRCDTFAEALHIVHTVIFPNLLPE